MLDENEKIMIAGGVEWSMKEAEEVIETMMELCSWIHENSLIPLEIKELVYRHYMPPEQKVKRK